MVVVKLNDTKNAMACRYLNLSNNLLYNNFTMNGSMSKSTFLKILRSCKIFKKPHRETDLCDYCEWSKTTQMEFSRRLRKIKNYVFPENLNFSKISGE